MMKWGCFFAGKDWDNRGNHFRVTRDWMDTLRGIGRVFKHRVRNESGIISTQLLISFILPLSLIGVILIFSVLGVAMKKEKYNSWFSNAMDYSTEQSIMGTDPSQVIFLEGIAKEYFKLSFAGMVGGSATGNTIQPSSDSGIPGPIQIEDFHAIEPGDQVPGGTAEQYGYVATIQVPVFNSTIPIVGERYITVRLTCSTVAKHLDGN